MDPCRTATENRSGIAGMARVGPGTATTAAALSVPAASTFSITSASTLLRRLATAAALYPTTTTERPATAIATIAAAAEREAVPTAATAFAAAATTDANAATATTIAPATSIPAAVHLVASEPSFAWSKSGARCHFCVREEEFQLEDVPPPVAALQVRPNGGPPLLWGVGRHAPGLYLSAPRQYFVLRAQFAQVLQGFAW